MPVSAPPIPKRPKTCANCAHWRYNGFDNSRAAVKDYSPQCMDGDSPNHGQHTEISDTCENYRAIEKRKGIR